jgi:hypothetical protein
MMMSWSQPMPVLRSVKAVARLGSDANETWGKCTV